MPDRRMLSNAIARPRCDTYEGPCLSATTRWCLLPVSLEELAAAPRLDITSTHVVVAALVYSFDNNDCG